ncbi:MAG TPA: von Willebrand factor type A domain-containing protein [Candidatus Limnocylindrales bacterium]|nr:von Willebrand factor type A domain-containing protein [Candidatus Limnocylindrales bacterium]
MRMPILLATVALFAAACGGTSATDSPANGTNPAHGGWTPEPWEGEASEAPAIEPAGTPYDGVTFEDPGVNPFVPTGRDSRSTFGLDVDTASYAIARRFIEDGNTPDPASIRVEEFVNAFEHDYPAPEEDTFALYADGAPTPFLDRDEVLLRLGVKAREIPDRSRREAALTFVIDTSGSMDREDRLELVKRSLRLLVDRLDREDSIAIVTYGTDARVVLEPTLVRDAEEIIQVIDGLHPDGSTNAEAGLALGYRLAAAAFREEGINRVILASDGVANVGETDPDRILDRLAWDRELGVQLVTVGFGMGNYNDALMERLADAGDGFYAYVNTLDDARTLFGDQLTSTLQAVALDARAQVDFEPGVVASYRLLGYENRDIADEQFRDDAIEAGAIGAGHAVTALYALRLTGDGRDGDRLATLRLRWIDPDTRRAAETALDIHVGELARSFDRASDSFRLDALVAQAAEVFRDSRWARDTRIEDVLAVADEVDLPRDAQAGEFLRLLEEATRLGR